MRKKTKILCAVIIIDYIVFTGRENIYLYLLKQVLEATGEVPGQRPQEEGHACSRREEEAAGAEEGGGW